MLVFCFIIIEYMVVFVILWFYIEIYLKSIYWFVIFFWEIDLMYYDMSYSRDFLLDNF